MNIIYNCFESHMTRKVVSNGDCDYIGYICAGKLHARQILSG